VVAEVGLAEVRWAGFAGSGGGDGFGGGGLGWQQWRQRRRQSGQEGGQGNGWDRHTPEGGGGGLTRVTAPRLSGGELGWGEVSACIGWGAEAATKGSAGVVWASVTAAAASRRTRRTKNKEVKERGSDAIRRSWVRWVGHVGSGGDDGVG